MGDVMPSLAGALAADANFKVMIASGYYDLACPMETVSYELRQMNRADLFSGRVTHTLYPSGHMIYLNPVALAQLKADITKFMSAPALSRF